MQIAAFLNYEEDAAPVSHHDLYNLKARTSRIQRHGLQASDALVVNLERDQANGEIYFRYYLNPSRQFSMVYFAVRSAVQYAQHHHEILILDCSCKTNKNDMPLLHYIGVDHHGHSFTIAFCLLNRETQENYDRALQWLIETVYTREEAIAWPSVVVTDCEVTLINIIHLSFPATSTKRILCHWHIMMNIRSRRKSSFLTEERALERV
ncbi:hypothetical protein K3495_g9281 [Podosphaera aphanis]|nr:hypothetical protein K3495_g9281 [Podosphaera aphanis]